LSAALPQICSPTLISVAATDRVPGGRTRSFVQQFTAGVVFAAAVELLLEISRGRQPIGIGFSLGVAVLLVIALTLEQLFLGVSVASTLGRNGMPGTRPILTVSRLSLPVIVVSLLGDTLLQGLALKTVPSFGAAALLSLVTEKLRTEAQKTPLIAATFSQASWRCT